MDSLILRRAVAIAMALLAGGLAASAAEAQDRAPVTRLVTYAARVCDRYADVTANRARNDIQESLQDLGPDTRYSAGEAISAEKEAAGQPACRPLTDWRFTLGTDYRTRAVVGPWGALTRVLNPYDTQIVTQTAVPLLDANGEPTGGSLAGAVTVPLTREQAQRAAVSSSLWVQGGTPSDPVLDQTYPGEYGFAALRCAVDDLNGDNVEWIAYPNGATHVLCFAYYVKPPPTSGTIVVRKVVDSPEATGAQAFDFVGNISYTEDHRFTLASAYGAPAEETFYRGAVGEGDPPWSVTEEVPEGWRLTGLDCRSATGTSAATTDLATGSASVRLAGGDTVTCTFVNALAPPQGTLQLSKRTIGGLGSFDYAISGPDSASQTIATTVEDVWADGPPLTLTAGEYEITETPPPAGPEGRWESAGVLCGGIARRTAGPVSVTVPPNAGVACAFTNRFIPGGSLVIRKTTVGGTGRIGFAISPVDDPGTAYEQVADVRRAGTPTRARGDSTRHLPLGAYRITEFAPGPPATGAWELESVVCNGRPVAASRGRATVRLTRDQPRLVCTFTDRYSRSADPGNPPIPTGPGEYTGASGSELSQASGPFADLEITKEVTPRVLRVGQVARYRIVVVNHGPDPATNVAVADLDASGVRPLSVRTSQGRCPEREPAPCLLGTIPPGGRVEIVATVRAARVGTTVNHVATASATADPNPANNRAQARVRVIRPAAAESGETAPAYTG